MMRWIILALVAATLFAAAPPLLSGDGDAVPETTATAAPAGSPARLPKPATMGELVTTADWFDEIFRGLSGEGRGRRTERPLGPFFGYGEEDEPPRSESGGYYRTMCVRPCDGFPIPLSFSTTSSNFGKDARRCAQACPDGRLFVYRNPGQEMEDMVDLDGHRYRDLPAAFLHQRRYVENCTCRGNPWDQEALARHKTYAEQATQKQAADRAERKGRQSSRSDGQSSRATRWEQSDAGAAREHR
jgi:hypothetical protein